MSTRTVHSFIRSMLPVLESCGSSLLSLTYSTHFRNMSPVTCAHTSAVSALLVLVLGQGAGAAPQAQREQRRLSGVRGDLFKLLVYSLCNSNVAALEILLPGLFSGSCS